MEIRSTPISNLKIKSRVFVCEVVRIVKLLRTFGMCGLYQRGGEIENERERLFIETTSLMTSKTILINGVDVYETYTKEMVF